MDENVLIPRQETEILVDEVLKRAGLIDKSEIKVLDIGTGSGNIPVSLAVNSEKILVDAFDISEGALNIARKNASRHNVSEKIQFSLADVLDNLRLFAGPLHDPAQQRSCLDLGAFFFIHSTVCVSKGQ